MTVQLDHTVIPSRDKHASAEFLARMLGIGPPVPSGHFVVVEVAGGLSLDYDDATDIRSQHFAFRVSEEEFDPIFERVKAEGITYYADPRRTMPGEINTRQGGRGFYFDDPDGHNMEVLTRRDVA